MTIRVRQDILVAHLDGESVLLDLETKNYFHLNATASAIWQGLEAGKGRRQIIEELQSTFDVSQEGVAVGFDDAIRGLVERKLVELAGEPGDA